MRRPKPPPCFVDDCTQVLVLQKCVVGCTLLATPGRHANVRGWSVEARVLAVRTYEGRPRSTCVFVSTGPSLQKASRCISTVPCVLELRARHLGMSRWDCRLQLTRTSSKDRLACPESEADNLTFDSGEARGYSSEAGTLLLLIKGGEPGFCPAAPVDLFTSKKSSLCAPVAALEPPPIRLAARRCTC